ncbi:hypothetical protein [Rhizobium rhizogenes]|uniref:hypothetical protein n=1 Tax=Rhizobium rhizogenes TaxID=359 RepID=UPI00080FDD19|nr:hypothetical protein [Rhizobium rhizogenes]OCJ08877.1 hypothetical protein A6U88_24075 [Agrobacterium sp. B131/95]MDJ1634977.1 hypothetical protein [Rhizobium rhizogenes]NTH20033.1 hypothetical protein [Rhizobium rhizogenes]NTH33043.1 hypothetical protein [Rhizobium rhizogenes]NTI36258.1 hypothetical protein [Rhizobium rhizogenes]
MTTLATAHDPVTGLLDAFKFHDLVALSDGGHGCEQAYAFRIALIRDPRFPALVNDIVVESGNSLYQSMMDRFISGEDIPDREIRKAWQNTTQAHDVWDSPVFEGLFREVRDLNTTLPKERQIRVLLGDPPIDWSKINNAAELRETSRALENRDSCGARIIQNEVLAKQRRALIIYGGMHLLRKALFWRSEEEQATELQSIPPQNSIVSLLETQGANVYSVWTPVDVDLTPLQSDLRSWPRPSLVPIRGTALGEASFRSYYPHAMFTGQLDALIKIHVDPERSPSMEEEFDAILYLGPPSDLTWSKVSPALAADPEYIKMRSDRCAWLGLPF